MRYKLTHARRAREENARAERQHEHTLALTINDVLNRGGKPKLCHCKVFSSDSYFITEHGYCRFCGGWTPMVFRHALGDAAMWDAISELDLHYRTEMTRLVSDSGAAVS